MAALALALCLTGASLSAAPGVEFRGVTSATDLPAWIARAIRDGVIRVAQNSAKAYGLDLVSQKRGSTTHYYGYDGLGTVRYLTDTASTPNVTDTYTYDAFGIQIASTGSTENNYRYTGEQMDHDLGLYYLRARYLNPATGRFWTMDTYEGNNSDPLSLHKYLYAHADPVNNTDPSGNMTSTFEFGIASMMSMSWRATWEANRVKIYGGAIAAALAVATYYGGSWALEEARQLAIARSALAAAGTSVANEIAKAKQILRTRRGNLRLPKIVPMPMSIIPAVAQNVAVGQLTTPGPLRRVGILQTIKNRYFATRSRGSAGPGMSWDEYPFASTAQGGSPAVVRPVPEKQNWIQGGIIAAAYVAEKISPGDWFEVIITP